MSEDKINNYIQRKLIEKELEKVDAKTVAKWLDEADILKDSKDSPGQPLRRKLRKGVIKGQKRENGRWFIYRVNEIDNENVEIKPPSAEATAKGLPPGIKAEAKQYYQLFNRYDDIHRELKELLEDDIPKPLIRFNIRLRINLSLDPQFTIHYGYLDNQNVRKVYQLLIRIVDAWFVYEELNDYIKTNYTEELQNEQVRFFYFNQELIEKLETHELVSDFNNQLGGRILSIGSRANDLIAYLEHLLNTCRGEQLKEKLCSFKTNIESKQELEHNEIIALIYAVRNTYVHNSDTAKKGMKSYTSKIELLSLLYEYLIEFMLTASISIMNSLKSDVE